MRGEERLLEAVLLDCGAVEVSAMELYSDIFKLGEGFIQRFREPPGCFKANPIILGSFNGDMRRRILFENTFEETLSEFQEADWAILNGLTYFGKSNSGSAQSKMCAMIFDLDGQTDATLNAFLHGAYGGGGFQLYPMPQYIALSGSNVHLYYVFDEPIDLYPNIKIQLKNLKYQLTDRIWNRYTSTIEKPQHQGINQGFRAVGTRTKAGGIVRVFRLDSHPITVEELNEFIPEEHRVNLDAKHYPESKYTLEQAKERWPEWYERVVLNNENTDTKHVVWPVKADLYNWWLRKCHTPGGSGVIGDRYYTNVGVTVGHRYFCLMSLAIFGVKCGIGKDKVRADMESLVPFFNLIDIDHPFGNDGEIDAAMECYDLRYVTFPRKDIERITAIAIPPNKRNGRKQEQHIRIMNAIRDIEYPDGAWRNKDGAPTKQDLIQNYAYEHPGESQRAIAKALGVSPATVNKWLKGDWRRDFEEKSKSKKFID